MERDESCVVRYFHTCASSSPQCCLSGNIRQIDRVGILSNGFKRKNPAGMALKSHDFIILMTVMSDNSHLFNFFYIFRYFLQFLKIEFNKKIIYYFNMIKIKFINCLIINLLKKLVKNLLITYMTKIINLIELELIIISIDDYVHYYYYQVIIFS